MARIPRKRKEILSNAERIEKIQVIPSLDHEFLVIVNDHTDLPLRLTKNTNSGRLIYTIAEQGEADFYDYEKAFQYLQRDKRSRLFLKTGIDHHKLLELQDDVITAHPTVKIEMIETSFGEL